VPANISDKRFGDGTSAHLQRVAASKPPQQQQQQQQLGRRLLSE